MEKSSFISVQDKVLQLQTKLQEFGVSLPDQDLEKLDKLKEDLKLANEIIPNTYQTFNPPHGGHTRSSKVRAEIQNFQNF